MRIRVISGYGIKGPACFLVETAGKRLLLDLGEGPDSGRRPDLAGIGAVDAIVFSHGHVDHTGALDLATELGSPKLYATAPVRALAKQPALRAAEDLPLSGSIMVAGVPIRTGLAGHAPGAVWMQINGADGLLYSGDFSRDSLLFPFETPPATRLCIIDCSYGAYDEPLHTGIRLVREEAAKGPIVLPAPAGGRGLEMALDLCEQGHAIQLCATHRLALDALLAAPSQALTAGAAARLARLKAAMRPLDVEGRIDGVALVAPADGNSGEARAVLARMDGSQPFACLFTGYIAAGSRAAQLLDQGLAKRIRWNVHPRLSDLKAFLNSARPQAVLPTFLAASALPELREALAAYPLSPDAASFAAEAAAPPAPQEP